MKRLFALAGLTLANLAVSTAPADAWWVRRYYYRPVYIHPYYAPRVVVVPRYYAPPPVVYVRPAPYVIVR